MLDGLIVIRRCRGYGALRVIGYSLALRRRLPPDVFPLRTAPPFTA